LQHNYSIYVDGWYKHIVTHGVNHGRIHPDINLHGTATGRRSYGRPAVQTIPRPSNKAEKYGRLRQAVIPTSDDYEIAYVDYTRAEIYTAFAYSHDPVMWEALQKDYHLETAVNVMHKSRARMMADPDYKEEMRRIAKIVTFGIFYGMEAYTLSQTAEIPVPEAQAYINAVFANNKHYDRWYKETLRQLERTGEVTSITGRKRRFVMLQPNPRVLKQAVNFPIQSTAGDVTLQAVIRLHEPLKALDCHILFDVHDAIVFEISKRHRYEAMQLIHDVMESPPFPDIAPDFPCIPTESYIGRSWGHAEKIKDFEAWRAA
jgi:DNA polymerase I